MCAERLGSCRALVQLDCNQQSSIHDRPRELSAHARWSGFVGSCPEPNPGHVEDPWESSELFRVPERTQRMREIRSDSAEWG